RTADGSVVQKLQGVGRDVWGVGWSPDGRSVAWGHTNRDVARNRAPLERTFRLDRLEFGAAPTADYVRTPAGRNGYSLRPPDPFRLAIERGGKQVVVFNSPDKGDRIYSYTLVPG